VPSTWDRNAGRVEFVPADVDDASPRARAIAVSGLRHEIRTLSRRSGRDRAWTALLDLM
jgi:hypothetical protein